MDHIPSGTITFLFTDIENSTEQWEKYPKEMNRAVITHDILLKGIIESNKGYIFKTVGDEFCVAFEKPLDALFTAIRCQENLLKQVWTPVNIKVRMGIHTGTAEERSGDYFGHTLNKTARLMSAGHGGQILISQTYEELIRDDLTEGVELKDLGSNYLKDIKRPEHIYQVSNATLIEDFPALRLKVVESTNLPLLLTSFIGRTHDIESITKMLVNYRLISLTGPGGVGKTRLAIEVSKLLINKFSNGIWFVDLYQVTELCGIYTKIAEILNVSDEPSIPLDQNIFHYLKRRECLIILDNCEHLIEESAEVSYLILEHCQNVKILSTSRESLKILGEVIFNVSSLSLPSFDITEPEVLTHYEAVQLFMERALSVNPQFHITDKNIPALIQICRWLDGMPLSLELAAEKTRIFGLLDIADRLQNRFQLLKTDNRITKPRQKTLKSLIDWSFDLLDIEEQTLLIKLAIFPGKWSTQIVEEICDDSFSLIVPEMSPLFEFVYNKTPANNKKNREIYSCQSQGVLELISNLVNKSLVNVETKDDETQYSLLESIHEYAREKLLSSNLMDTLKERYIKYYIIELEKNEAKIIHDANDEEFLKFTSEYKNIELALGWGINNKNLNDLGKRLVGALYFYWKCTGHIKDGLYWSEKYLALPDNDCDNKVKWKLLWGASIFAFFMVKREVAWDYIREEREISKSWGLEVIDALSYRVQQLLNLNDSPDLAYEMAQNSLTVFTKYNLIWWKTTMMINLSLIYDKRGQKREKEELLKEAMEIAHRTNQSNKIGVCSMNIADSEFNSGNYKRCIELYDEVLITFENNGSRLYQILVLNQLGRVYRNLGNIDKAYQYFIRSKNLCEELGFKVGLERVYCYLSQINILQGRDTEGKQLLCESLSFHKLRDYDNWDAVYMFTISEVLYELGYKEFIHNNIYLIEVIMKKFNSDFNKSDIEHFEEMKKGMRVNTAEVQPDISYEQFFEACIKLCETEFK